jgi:hypothetical protein
VSSVVAALVSSVRGAAQYHTQAQDNLTIVAGAKCHGQKRQDIDLLIFGGFAKGFHPGKDLSVVVMPSGLFVALAFELRVILCNEGADVIGLVRERQPSAPAQ